MKLLAYLIATVLSVSLGIAMGIGFRFIVYHLTRGAGGPIVALAPGLFVLGSLGGIPDFARYLYSRFIRVRK